MNPYLLSAYVLVLGTLFVYTLRLAARRRRLLAGRSQSRRERSGT